MARIRYHVSPRDAPPAIAARALGLTAEAFTAALPDLLARGFPPADVTTGNFDLKAIDRWQDGRHPRLFHDGASVGNQAVTATPGLIRQRMREMGERADAELRAAPMTKRERDALAACALGNGEPDNGDGHRARALRWLRLHGLIETKLDQGQHVTRLTPAGEAEWQRQETK